MYFSQIYFDQSSKAANEFAANFRQKCAVFLDYIANPPQKPEPETHTKHRKHLFHRFSNHMEVPQQKIIIPPGEVNARAKFKIIWKMLKIAGLADEKSKFVFLAKKLAEVNEEGNYIGIISIIKINNIIRFFL